VDNKFKSRISKFLSSLILSGTILAVPPETQTQEIDTMDKNVMENVIDNKKRRWNFC